MVTQDVAKDAGATRAGRPLPHASRIRSRTESSPGSRADIRSSRSPGGFTSPSGEQEIGEPDRGRAARGDEDRAPRRREGRVHEPGRHPRRHAVRPDQRRRAAGPGHLRRALRRAAVRQLDRPSRPARDSRSTTCSSSSSPARVAAILLVPEGFTYTVLESAVPQRLTARSRSTARRSTRLRPIASTMNNVPRRPAVTGSASSRTCTEPARRRGRRRRARAVTWRSAHRCARPG